MAPPTRIKPLGLLIDCEGEIINIARYALPSRPAPEGLIVIGVVGASMNAGKTTAAASLAHGKTIDEILGGSMVAEGVRTAKSVMALARQQDVEMPIAQQVYNVLYEGAPALGAVTALMLRDAKPENG